MDNTEMIGEIEGSLDHVETMLRRFRDAQSDDSDEANEDLLEASERALEDLRGHVGDLVP